MTECQTGRLRDNAARIATLAWPLLVGQLSVMAFSTIDTLLLARYSAPDLAALAVGSATYAIVFIGLTGVVMAVAPICGQLFGAGKHEEAGAQLQQAAWLALMLALPGSLLLCFPSPFMALAQMAPDVEDKTRAYLAWLALSLPASLLFASWRGFNNAVSRPKAVMLLQVGALALKVPMSALLIHGLPGVGLPALGVVGCSLGTMICMWLQVGLALLILRRDPFYDRFALRKRGLMPPDMASLRALLRLGVPMGMAIVIDVSGFVLMAVFIARLGTTVVAGHQIVANLVAILFMLPLALANATGMLVAQRIGGADLLGARRLGWHGMQLGVGLALLIGGLTYLAREEVVRLYTSNPLVISAALPLLAWVAVFHVADAAQAVAVAVLRAHRIVTLPMFVFGAAVWGVGLGGGYVLAFDVPGFTPAALRGAPGYWAANTAGLALTAIALTALMVALQRQRTEPSGPRQR